MSLRNEIARAYKNYKLKSEQTIELDKLFNANELHQIVASLSFIGTFAISNIQTFNGFEVVAIKISRFNGNVEQSDWGKLRREFEIGFNDYVEYHLLRSGVCHVTKFSDHLIEFVIPVSVYARKYYMGYIQKCEMKRIQMEHKKKLRDSRLKEIQRNAERNR